MKPLKKPIDSINKKQWFNICKNIVYSSLKSFNRYSSYYTRCFDINRFKQIFIEPCNLCHLKCPYCPTGMRLKLRDTPQGMLKIDTLKDICERSLKRYTGNIALYNWGEPFLNPELPEMVRYLKETTKAKLVINSNFSFHNDKRLKEALLYLNGDTIIISCDGYSQETCEKYRKKVDFENVMHNIELLIKNRPPNTSIMWQYLEFPWSLNEIEDSRKYCAERNIIFYTSVGGITPDYPMLPIPKTNDAEKFKCDVFFDSLVINFDGEVYPCCGYYGPRKYSLGNARKISLEEIFTKYKGKDMLDYLSCKTAGNENLFCKHCVERDIKELESWKF
jgi:radical SAM protein with 4Fe4S-binding SPASM domain